jgi:hypothetical protein
MFPLISVVLVILGSLGIRRLLQRNRKRPRQVRFIRETSAANRTLDNRRVIASLSTVPDRISACIGHDAKCASAAMDCVVKQDPRSSETQQ